MLHQHRHGPALNAVVPARRVVQTTVRGCPRLLNRMSLQRCVDTSSPYQRTLQHHCLYHIPLLTASRPSLHHTNNPAVPDKPTPPNKNSLTTRRYLASTRRRCSSTSAVCLFYTYGHLLQEPESHWEHSTQACHPDSRRSECGTRFDTHVLTRTRWAQGACCIRQDHCPCLEAVLWP